MPSSARARADFVQIKRQSTYRRGVHCAPERGQPQGLSLRITNQMYSVQISRTDKDVRPYAYQMHALPREILRFAQNDKSAQFVGGGFPRPPEQSWISHKTNGDSPTVGACIARPNADSRKDCPYGLQIKCILCKYRGRTRMSVPTRIKCTLCRVRFFALLRMTNQHNS